MLHDVLLAADHHAVATFQAPHTATGAHVHVVDSFGCEFLGALDIVHVIGVSAVDEDVACLEMRQQIGDGLIDDCRRNHQPYRAWFLQFLHQIDRGIGSDRVIFDKIRHRLG